MIGNYSNNHFSGGYGGDQFRKMEPYSPKSSSPRGGTSPSRFVSSRQDSSGTLKTKISLGKIPSIVHSGPFYTMKEPPEKKELTGATNLMAYYNLEHSYSKYSSGKKVKEQLSSFVPNLPGVVDGMGNMENSSLRSVIEKPPIGGKELLPLSSVQLAGFRLHPGPLPEKFRILNNTPVRKHKNKHKKHKLKDGTIVQETLLTDPGLDTHEKKHKKQKRNEDDKERKKRKKEKKRKKQRHSPEHLGGPNSGTIIPQQTQLF